MMNVYLLLPLIFLSTLTKASVVTDTAYSETAITLKTKTGDIFGTLTCPKEFSEGPVAVIIAGSGPTDRDGNNPMLKNDALKKLAYRLAESKVASVRFDKRGIGKSHSAGGQEVELRFGHYINDVTEWVHLLKQDRRFTSVTVIGHSEGALIGMVASKGADGYVSIAGAGESADNILKRQLSAQPQQVKDLSYPIIDSLKDGRTVEDVNPMLLALFRPSVQPYLISWFQYDPQEEIKKVSLPVLIVQGTNDLQVSPVDANLLSTAKPEAEVVLIEQMNHIFRIVQDSDTAANLATYNKPDLPISEKLVKSIVDFIHNKL